MRRSRYSNGSFLYQTPNFASFDWCGISHLSNWDRTRVPVKPWEPVTTDVASDQLEFIHNTIGDGEDILEGCGYISYFKSIFKFDVIPQENWNDLEYFQEEIQKWYNQTTPLAPLWNTMGLWGPYKPKHPTTIENDLLVMVKLKDGFYRGCILCQQEDTPFYYVEILDYGFVQIIDREEIFEMAQRFAMFPVQPIRCCLNLPYHFMHLKEWVDDAHFDGEVAEFQEELVRFGYQEMMKMLETSSDESVKIDYVWKNYRKCGEPWMVNIKTIEKDSKPSVDLIEIICEKMTEKLHNTFEAIVR